MTNSSDHEISFKNILHKRMHLFPQIVTGEETWNSSADKEFVSRIEFRFPNGHGLGGTGDEVFPGSGSQQFEFVENLTDVADGKFYDPWYTHCMTTGGASFPSSANNMFDSGKGAGLGADYNGPNAAFGLSFRNGVDFDSTTAAPGWRTNSSSTDTMAFAVYFVCNTGNGNKMDTWDLHSRYFPYTSSILTHEGEGQRILRHTIDRTKDPDNSMYHTLEVRCKKNKLSVYFDGSLVKTFDDLYTDERTRFINVVDTEKPSQAPHTVTSACSTTQVITSKAGRRAAMAAQRKTLRAASWRTGQLVTGLFERTPPAPPGNCGHGCCVRRQSVDRPDGRTENPFGAVA